jgi:hypothetical protein
MNITEMKNANLEEQIIVNRINIKLHSFICESDLPIDEFYKTLDRKELEVYAKKSKQADDLASYDELMKILEAKA